MWIGILGPFEIRTEGPVPIADPGGRGLLALLAANRERSLPPGRIASVLWPADPPADPEAAVTGAAASLGPGLGDVVEVSPAGYRLARSAEVDAEQYARLVGDARRLTRPDPDRALELLGRAERLWRGEPFEDVPHVGGFNGIGRILEEVHTIHLETKASALIRTRRAPEAVPVLAAVTRRDPHREHPVALLVEALSVSGHREEAVRTFERWRVRLVEELGIEPGPEVTASYREALARPAPDDPAI